MDQYPLRCACIGWPHARSHDFRLCRYCAKHQARFQVRHKVVPRQASLKADAPDVSESDGSRERTPADATSLHAAGTTFHADHFICCAGAITAVLHTSTMQRTSHIVSACLTESMVSVAPFTSTPRSRPSRHFSPETSACH